MGRYLLRRLLLAIVTLWLIATFAFLIVNVLPGNVGRKVLGPFAPKETVDAYNQALGTNDPFIDQYGRSMKNLVTLDFGDSFQYKQPATELLRPAVFRSLKLAGLALVLTVPISIAAGVYAGRRKDRLVDRAIVTLGLASSSIPEFVTGTLLIVVVGVKLKWLKPLSIVPPGTSLVGEFKYLLLPALSMAIVYFGYIARMSRAGTIAAVDSDYTRTAVMKGLSNGQVLRRHVLRNAMGPTVSVVGTQIGYLFGGLIGVEKIFNYNGMGLTLLQAVKTKDVPVLQAGVIIVGIIYMLATLAADLTIAWLNPRTRLELDQ